MGIAEIIVGHYSTGSTLRVMDCARSERCSLPAPSSSPRCDTFRAHEERSARVAHHGARFGRRARGKRYLMANVPRGRSTPVKQIIPGITARP